MDVVSTLTVTKGDRIDDGQGQNSLGVFRAFDPQLKVNVALKEIAKAGRDAAKFFEEAQRMFESEHPNVVPIRTASQTPDTILLVMPLYENGSLKTRIDNGPLSIGETIRVGREILAGVGAIHAGGSVHFDIKPSNVLIADNGVAKVADFGQARELGPDGFTLFPERMYAPLTPPEAFSNDRADRLADIYQVGATLYRAVNGEPFFAEQFAALTTRDALRNAITTGRFPNSTRFLPHVPERLKRAIRKAMRTDPAQRFQSASEFSNALTKVLPALNWSMRNEPNGAVRWETERLNQPNLCVSQCPNGSLYDVQLHTVRGNALRATKKGFWKSRLKKRAANEYLKLLFVALA